MKHERMRKKEAPDGWVVNLKVIMEDLNRILNEYLGALRSVADKPGSP